MSHFRRAHHDENLVVNNLWKKGYLALRIPVSGAGNFKTDVLAFLPNQIKLILVRRKECSIKKSCKECLKINEKCKANTVIFKASEIMDAWHLASRIATLLYPNSVLIELKAHFSKQRKWVEKQLLDWDGKDVEVQADVCQ
jgi:Holliday junction resolvase